MIRFTKGTYRWVGEELSDGDFTLTDRSLEADLKAQLNQQNYALPSQIEDTINKDLEQIGARPAY